MAHILNEEQIREFIHWMRDEEKASSTREKYLKDIYRFTAWLGGRSVSKETVTGWKEYMVERHYAVSTINSALSALNGLFQYLGWNDCHAKFLRVQRRAFRDPNRELARSEYEALIAAAKERKQERLTLLMETICATGIRVSEVKYITVEAADRGRAEIALKGKVRTILIPGKLRRKLLKYARKNKTASGEIFLTRDGKSLSRHQIWAEMKRLCKYAEVEPTKVFPHNLRHVFAVTFYRVSRDIVKLADILGHSSIETTRIYLLTSGAEHQRQLDRLGLVS